MSRFISKLWINHMTEFIRIIAGLRTWREKLHLLVFTFEHLVPACIHTFVHLRKVTFVNMVDCYAIWCSVGRCHFPQKQTLTVIICHGSVTTQAFTLQTNSLFLKPLNTLTLYTKKFIPQNLYFIKLIYTKQINFR